MRDNIFSLHVSYTTAQIHLFINLSFTMPGKNITKKQTNKKTKQKKTTTTKTKQKQQQTTTQLAFYINLQRTVIGPSATLTGRKRPAIDLCRMFTGNNKKNPNFFACNTVKLLGLNITCAYKDCLCVVHGRCSHAMVSRLRMRIDWYWQTIHVLCQDTIQIV